MPYARLAQLPERVRKALPKHAQEIYLAAYNNAWDEYAKAGDRRDEASREETAHRVAWNAVKKQYEKRDGKWRRKE